MIRNRLPGKYWLVAIFLLIFIPCSYLQSNGQTGSMADTVLPKSIQVTKKNDRFTTIIHLNNGQIVKLNDSQTRSFINQSFEAQPKVFMFVQQMPSFPGGDREIAFKKLGKDRGLGYICGDGGEGSAV